MTTIADWAERPLPIEATATVGEARRRFDQDCELSCLAVVEEGRPIGVLYRAVALACDDGTATSEAPVLVVMAKACVLATVTTAAEALAVVTADAGGAFPIVLTDQGFYAGLVTQASLLKALQHRGETDVTGRAERAHFVEMLGREIRTPMTGVLAVAELLQRQPLTADAQAYVRTIVDSCEGLVRLVDDALDLAMGETGRLEPKPTPVRLRDLMDEIQEEWQARRTSSVSVLVSYDGDPDLGVMADGLRLRQVFGNLIAAALKTTRQGAVEASLKARPHASGVRLEARVRDCGPGLEPDQLARIFEAAAHAGGPRTGWSGLGPALCRRIVEAMNGTIRAESNVGEGVTVTFELMAPVLEAEAAEAGPGRIDSGGVHVLVVDDNATNRMVAEGLCEMFDCTSECAEDGVEAVEAARSGRYHLILMDIKMPRMDGVEATLAIRDLPGEAGKVPIIALTANADPEDARRYIASGMCDVVEKPIKPERLLQAINDALGAQRGRAVRAA